MQTRQEWRTEKAVSPGPGRKSCKRGFRRTADEMLNLNVSPNFQMLGGRKDVLVRGKVVFMECECWG